MSEKEPQIIIPLRDYFQLSLYCLVNELELCKEDEVLKQATVEKYIDAITKTLSPRGIIK